MAEVDATMTGLAPHSDEEVLARVSAGDIAAFELLMRRHNQRLYRVARSVVHNDLEAEDVVQEAYVRAYAHLHRFEGRSSVATWLTRIAFHEALRRRRRRLREVAAVRSLAEARSHTPGECEEAGMNDAGDSRSSLTRALDSLPEIQRAVVVLRLAQGLSTRETGECLRISEANVKALLHRGKQALQGRLQGREPGDLHDQYTFGHERCDRVVEAVLRRIVGGRLSRPGR